jgi:hypothetical protein
MPNFSTVSGNENGERIIEEEEEIANTVLLYNPSTLKQAYNLARQIEKSLEGQTKIFRPSTRFDSQLTIAPPIRNIKSKDEKSESFPTDTTRITELAPSKTLTIDQKKILGLCYRCGDEFFSRHKCKTKGIHVMKEDSLNDIEDHS